MNLKPFLPALLLAVLLMSCENQSVDQVSLKDGLVQQLINAEETQSSKIQGKIIILRTGYCETFDCEEYFRDYSAQIQVYAREDIFMRGILNYLEIESIDEGYGRMVLRKRTGKESARMEIQL